MNHSVKIKHSTKLQFKDFLQKTNYTADDVINAGMRYLNNKRPAKAKLLVMKIYEPEKKIENPFKPKRINGKTIYSMPAERIVSG